MIKVDKVADFEMPGRCIALVSVASLDPVQVEIDGIPVAVIAGKGKLRERLEGEVLTLRSKTPFGAQVEMRPLQKSEPVDLEEPPLPNPAMNYLAKLREKVRREMGVTREMFLENDTGLPGYEIEDDTDGLFEEELSELAKLQQKDEDKRATQDTRPSLSQPQSPKPTRQEGAAKDQTPDDSAGTAEDQL